jgi:hypothetical protein
MGKPETCPYELVTSEVCRTDDEVLACQARWREGLKGKGWTK